MLILDTRTWVIHRVDKIVAMAIIEEINKTFLCQNCQKWKKWEIVGYHGN